jgi:ferric-dicitrate binding protein FerR (iron transport regulator)
MKKEKHIENLLQKYTLGDLSPQEAGDLSSLLAEGDGNPEVKTVMDTVWQASFYEKSDVPTEKLWNRLKQNLPAETLQLQVDIVSSFRKILPFLKYAAVIVITVGLTWFGKDIFTGKSSGRSADASDGDKNVIAVSFGSKSKVTLPDGSTVNLNSGSTLTYPSKFSRTSRNVYVEGEAFFDVQKDPKHPFYVKTRDIVIKVLGTKFNVKSYSDEKTIQATLVTGLIEIYSSKKGITDKNRLIALQPNQQATIEKGANGLTIIDTKDQPQESIVKLSKGIAVSKQIDVAPVVAWKDNRLIFRDEKFTDLSRKLERWYDVEIEIKDPELRNALFSGVFVKETIEQALTALRLATPFQYEMKKNRITIFNKTKL